ncbi:MAG TPA: hypothetical protein VJ201_01520 [Candidatus Babeliales bacterium]|nr:hypothetical protein [Candidatus Babeliales bacterium]
MHKRIVLLLLIVSPSMHAMESYSSEEFFSSFCSYLSQWAMNQASGESEFIQKLRISRNQFEEQLQVFTLRSILDDWTIKDLANSIDANPLLFLEHCYHQRFFWRNVITWSSFEVSLINKCKKARIDGYSALGAACIARDISIGHKRDFIRPLMEHGFELTEKDKALAVIELYDAIPVEQKKKIIFLLFILGQGDFTILPDDVGKEIVYCIVYPFKEDVWPLPDNY